MALEEELDRVRNFYRQKLEGLSKRQAQAGRPVSVSDAKSQREVDRFRAKATALEVKGERLHATQLLFLFLTQFQLKS